MRGFTLIELLLALALTALVATAALATLNTFADADQQATQSMEQSTGTDRALQMLRTDLGDAVALDYYTTYWVATRRDGTAVGYAIAVGGTELHRFEAADASTATGKASSAATATTTAPTAAPRGHLRDADYRSEAVLQGVRSIAVGDVTRTGTTLGVQVTVVGQDGRTRQCVAMSVPLLETYSKSAAIAAGSAAADAGTSSGGSGGGGLVGGLLDTAGGLLGGSSTNDSKTTQRASKVK